MTRGVALAAALAVLASETAARADVRIAPGPSGSYGAWLLAGPFRAKKPALETAPAGVDERAIHAALGEPLGAERDVGKRTRPPARWVPAWPASDEPRRIDVKALLEDAGGEELVAYAAGRLHLESAARVALLLGVDDGVRVLVDGAPVFTRDIPRGQRDDDDVIPLDLAAGDHELVLKLHQRAGAWSFRAKVVDRTLAPPAGSFLTLAGPVDATALAPRLAAVTLDRAFAPARGRYEPTLAVRFPDGTVLGEPLPVSVTAPGFSAKVGAGELVVALPPVTSAGAVETTVAGRAVAKTTITPRPRLEQAVVHLARALEKPPAAAPGSLDSARFLARRALRLLSRGDADLEAQAEEAAELDGLAERLEQGRDPYEGRTGMMRRAIVTQLDEGFSELGLYVPPSYKPGSSRRYPLVVGLHGLNSFPLSMMRALFGLDDDKKEPAWKDRHGPQPPAFEAFVITPYAHGNTMYREIGEDDVLLALDWARHVFPIDDARITVTGPSMGGIGAASLPLHFPHLFAAAEPLCGYHSYLIRPELVGRPLRPWERFLLEERSNVSWAENGEHLPLYIVHGTRDLPEANSGVLIERYEKLKYAVKHEHPDVGHNVWGPTYAELKGLNWLLGHRLDPKPAHVRFRTPGTRWGTSAWVAVNELAGEATWADVDARRSAKGITATTSGASELAFGRDPMTATKVTLDGVTLSFEENEPIVVHRQDGTWAKGPLAHERPVKRGHVTGPIRDVFHEPVTFVWASDPSEARATERVAKSFADRPGIPTSYPMMSDVEFLARGEPLANDRALFLVGRTNRVLAALGDFPIRVDADGVLVGTERIEGKDLGAAFVHPNPQRPDRYVVVVAGTDAVATIRALALPDLLPDFVVWDEGLMPARGQTTLAGARLRAGGLFRSDWSLPRSIVDPLASRTVLH